MPYLATPVHQLHMPQRPKLGFRPESEGYSDMTIRCQQVYSELASGSTFSRIGFLCDTRSMHRTLFAPCAPPGYEDCAGSYRGEKGKCTEFSHVGIPNFALQHRSTGSTVAPQNVIGEMAKLATYIRNRLPTESPEEQYFRFACRVFRDFNIIHPYVDGNGHIARLVFAALLTIENMRLSCRWTLHERPYDGEIVAFCLAYYPDNPELLECYLYQLAVSE